MVQLECLARNKRSSFKVETNHKSSPRPKARDFGIDIRGKNDIDVEGRCFARAHLCLLPNIEI